MTQKAYTTGSTCPPLSKDTLRLYSMRYCPYAQRTRLVLSHLNIPFECVNVNLSQKPEWFLTKNPFGQVPVLEKDGKIVYESTVCDEYLEELHGGHQLLPADSYQKARVKIMMESVSKVTDKFYALMKMKTEEEKAKGLEELRKAAKIFEDHLSGRFFGGDRQSMLDLHLWPWFERMPTLDKMTGVIVISADLFPKLTSWIAAMKTTPAVKATIFDDESHYNFVLPYVNKQPIDYDVGL